jgi:4-amino-4-deoxy-L-arabinose transferase-like glycosyltransferase
MTTRAGIAAPASLAIIFALAVALYWYGIGPGDAERYIDAALRWQDGPWLGDTHWSLRHLFVLPMAASFTLFGSSEAAAIIPNIVYAGLTVAITWTYGRRHLGDRAGFIAAALVSSSAFFVARPLELDVYGAEAFFAALSCWVFVAARENDRGGLAFVAAGVCAGLAWSVREQAAYLMVAFGVLLLLDRKRTVQSIALVFAGFASVIVAELLLYAIAAGDPFYRYRIDLSHRDIGFNPPMTAERAQLPARAARLGRYLATTPSTTPMLLLAVGAAYYLRRTRASAPFLLKPALAVFAAIGVISALVASIAFNVSATRYYPLLTYGAFLIVAAAIARASSLGRPWLAGAAAVSALIVNIAAADMTRDGDYSEARALAQLAATSAEPVFADPISVGRARYMLRLKGWDSDAASAKVMNGRGAPPGALIFKTERLKPPEPYCILRQMRPRKTGWTHALLRETGAAKLLGARAEAIVAQPQPAYLLRLLHAPAAADPVTGAPCLARAP